MSYKEYIYDKFIFKVKEGIYYHNDGCWVKVLDNSNIVTVGITDFLQILNGDISSIKLFGVGVNIRQGETFGDIETMKVSFELTSPVTGKISEQNNILLESPELVNLEPYESGWLVKIELADFNKDRINLMDSDKYFDYMKQQVEAEGRKLGKE